MLKKLWVSIITTALVVSLAATGLVSPAFAKGSSSVGRLGLTFAAGQTSKTAKKHTASHNWHPVTGKIIEMRGNLLTIQTAKGENHSFRIVAHTHFRGRKGLSSNGLSKESLKVGRWVGVVARANKSRPQETQSARIVIVYPENFRPGQHK